MNKTTNSIIVMNFRGMIYVLLSLLTSMSSIAGDINLELAYRQLDQAISQTDKYVSEREERIQKYKTALEVTNDLQAQYEMCRKLFEEYQPYVNDSAIYYIGKCINLARAGEMICSSFLGVNEFQKNS